jgi:hypothetical protein
MGAWCGEDPRTTREKKHMDTEATTGQTEYGLVPARKTNFLVGEYYSLDRCPLMGTKVALWSFLKYEDYELRYG